MDDSIESWDAFKYAILESENKDLEKLTIVYSEEKAGDEEYRTGEVLLEEAKKRASGRGIEADTKLLIRGLDPDEDIVRFAEENRYDQIIVGHKGKSGIRGALLGSVAEGVVESAHCVVSVVRSTPYFEKDGKRIRPKDIEVLLEEHEGVERSVVIGSITEDDEDKIIAVCEQAEGYEPQEEMLMDYMKDLRSKGKIKYFAIPDQLEIVEELPKSKGGTVNRDKLRNEYV